VRRDESGHAARPKPPNRNAAATFESSVAAVVGVDSFVRNRAVRQKRGHPMLDREDQAQGVPLQPLVRKGEARLVGCIIRLPPTATLHNVARFGQVNGYTVELNGCLDSTTVPAQVPSERL
jgi:hypothetical protein